MPRCLSFSGWGQPVDALATLAGDNHQAVDYAACERIEAVAELVSDQKPELAIGWSLGGQVLLRLVSMGAVQPQRMVLLATPYQFVADGQYPRAMSLAIFNAFRASMRQAPETALPRFLTLIAQGDSNRAAVRRQLSGEPETIERWLSWLDELGRFSCAEISLESMPPTLVVHGQQDMVVAFEQGEKLASALLHASRLWLPDCAHAPHFHAPERILAAMESLFDVV